MKKRKFGFYFRFIISGLLIYFVFHKAGLGELWNVLKGTDFLFLGLSVAITPVLIFISSWKWQVILRAQDIHISLFRLFGLYMVGYFFNTVLPTNVGGDVVRAFSLGKTTGKKAESLASVFLERFTGLTALLLMAIIAMFLAIRALWNIWLFITMGVALLGYLAILIVVFNERIMRQLSSRVKIGVLRKVLIKLTKFQAAAIAFKHKKALLAFAMANSFLFYIAAAINVWLCAMAFSAGITIIDAFIITPIVLVITMIPISIGGIGLSESAYFFTFSRIGSSGPMGLSVAILLRSKAVLYGLLGGIYYSSMDMQVKEVVQDKEADNITEKSDVKGDVNYYSGFEDIMRRKRSPLAKYQDIVMGNTSLPKLFLFEVLTFLFGQVPGMLGLFSRQIFYRPLFKRMGKGIIIGRNVSLRHTGKISLGKSCVIDEYCMLSAQGDENSSITLGNEVLLGRDTVVSTRNGTIEIGDYSNIGASCRLGTTERLKLGKHVLIAAYCYIGGAQHRFDRLDVPIIRQGYTQKGGVVIEDDVWLAADVKVVDGVTIGEGAVIGAGSVVTKDIPPYAVAVGIPAKVRGSRRDLVENKV